MGELTGVPFAGLPQNLNPWPDVYFTGLTYGGEGLERFTGIRKTMADAELQVQRERLLAAQQIRTLQELLARERLNFQAVVVKNKAEKEEVDAKIPPLQRIIEELNAKIKENQAEIKKYSDMVPPRDEEILKLKGLLENEQKLRDTAERALDFERKGAEEKIVNLERGLQVEKDALAELRHGRHVQALVNPIRYPLTMKGVGQRKNTKNNDRKSHSDPSAFFFKESVKTLASCSELSCCTCKARERGICANKRQRIKATPLSYHVCPIHSKPSVKTREQNKTEKKRERFAQNKLPMSEKPPAETKLI